MKAVERLHEYLRKNNIPPTRFEKEIGLSNGYLGVQLKRGSDLGETILNKIIDNCLEINPEWLLTGRGNMLRSDEKPEAIVAGENKGIPYYAVDFLAGFDSVYNDQTVAPNAMISFPNIKGAECWVDVSGKSMEPLISPGDVIAIREVKEWRKNILYGEVYAIVTEEYRTIKRIRRAPSKDYITLVPENPDYDSQDILAEDVRAVYQVLGCAKKIF